MANPPEQFSCPVQTSRQHRAASPGFARLGSARLSASRRECSNEHDAQREIKPRSASTPPIYVCLRSQSELQRAPKTCAHIRSESFPSREQTQAHIVRESAFVIALFHFKLKQKDPARAQFSPFGIPVYVFSLMFFF